MQNDEVDNNWKWAFTYWDKYIIGICLDCRLTFYNYLVIFVGVIMIFSLGSSACVKNNNQIFNWMNNNQIINCPKHNTLLVKFCSTSNTDFISDTLLPTPSPKEKQFNKLESSHDGLLDSRQSFGRAKYLSHLPKKNFFILKPYIDRIQWGDPMPK